MSLSDREIADLQDEVKRGRAKFPNGTNLLPALMEEVGELARALLQDGNGRLAHEEALDVACVAMRIYAEGVPEFDDIPPGDKLK